MADILKRLGQAIGTAADVTLYTVGAGKQTSVSSVVFCNQAATSAVFRFAVVPNGETLAAKHYLAYDAVINANEPYPFTIGVAMSVGDTIHFTAPTTVSVGAWGVEVDA